ncbi:short-chain dehydrogenase [Mycena rebaudengoi]|nr:short-chain dehydrogenase [Mycena rebaudengoi]
MGRMTLLSFIRDQREKRPPVERVDLTGKTVVVVEANAGLGFEATKHFATMNPGRLILACHSQIKGQEALDKLKTETKYTGAELWLLDLSDFASVRKFADKFEQDGSRLDILLENARTLAATYEASKNGIECGLQVNCLSLSLLALLLLPRMLQTARDHSTLPRIVLVSSGLHYWATIDKCLLKSPNVLECSVARSTPPPSTLSNTSMPINYLRRVMGDRYPVTKMINVFLIRALNECLGASVPIVVNCVDPGYCYSNFRKTMPGIMAIVDSLMEKAISLPTEVGSRQLVWAALGEQEHPEKLRGESIYAGRVEEVSDYILSAEGVKIQNRLWQELIEMLGKLDPRVKSTINECLARG